MHDAADYNEIIDTLAHLICADRDNPALPRTTVPGVVGRGVELAFDGFEIFGGERNQDKFVLMPEDLFDIPVWPLDVCVATPANESWGQSGWQFSRIRSFTPEIRQEWRGRMKTYLPRMIDMVITITTQDGVRNSVRLPIGITREAAIDLRGSRAIPEDIVQRTQIVAIAAGLSLRRRYHWSVLLGEGAGSRARFITDLTGARSAFRLRDFPPGKERRAALRHWVREHWRQQRRTSTADRTWIREHLRGATQFAWNGLRCQMEPPEIDNETTIAGSAASLFNA